MAKYTELRDKIEELEKRLWLREKEIADAHAMCDNLDVPKSKNGAWVGHRLYWYSEGKRESYKTKENTEGYSPEEWKRRQIKLEEITRGGAAQKPKQSKLNIIPDEL